MPTSLEQLELNQANLNRVVDPINQYSDRSLKLTLDDVERRQRIADEERRADRNVKSQERIIAGAEARDRARELLRLATSLGIKIPRGATDEEVAKLVKDRKEEVAANALTTTKNLFDQDRKELNKRREQLANKRESIVNASLSPLQKAQILKTVLSQPEYADSLRKESKAKVEALLKMDLTNSKDSDVDSLVNNIYSDIKNNYLIFGGKEKKKADAFNEAYHSLAGEMLTAAKQVDYADWAQQMKDVTAEASAIERGRSDALKTIVREHGAFLKPETIERISIEASPSDGQSVSEPAIKLPANLQSAMSNVGTKAPKESPSISDIEVKPLERRLNERGAVGEVVDVVNRNVNPLNTPLGLFVPGTPANAVAAEGLTALPNITKRFLFGDPEATAPTAQEIAAGRAARDARVLAQLEEQRKALSTLSPQVHDAIRSKALRMGVSPQDLKIGDQLIQNGDLSKPETQNAIRTALLILNSLSGNISALPTVRDESQLAPLPQ